MVPYFQIRLEPRARRDLGEFTGFPRVARMRLLAQHGEIPAS